MLNSVEAVMGLGSDHVLSPVVACFVREWRYDTAHPRGSNYVQNRAAFSIIKSHWFKFSFNSPLERIMLARALIVLCE